jgi:hypothetical protein
MILKVRKVPKRAKKFLKMHIRVLLSAQIKGIFICKKGCWILTNLCHADNFKSSRGHFFGRISCNLLWPLRIMIYFIWSIFQKFLEEQSAPNYFFFLLRPFRKCKNDFCGILLFLFYINYYFFCFVQWQLLRGLTNCGLEGWSVHL